MQAKNGSLRDIVESHTLGIAECIGKMDSEQFERIVDAIEKKILLHRTIFVVGNGGSAATASHFANDLLKTASDGKIKIVALTDNVPLITAIANDHGYEKIFAEQLDALGTSGDALVVFSASGNSENVLLAAETARNKNILVISFLGMGGGELIKRSDLALLVTSYDYGVIEDVHVIINHLLTKIFKLRIMSRSCESVGAHITS